MSQQSPNNTQQNTNDASTKEQNLDEYHELIVSTLKILYNQLDQARKDIVEIEQIKQQALQDPLGYVELFKAKRAPLPPKLQKIPAIPNIGFRTDHAEFDMRKVVQFATETCKYLIPPSDGQASQDQPSPYIPIPTNQQPVSQTYKQPWTEQEQRQLVELLELYPEEEVQYQRFLKIAKALGTRTVTQVSSRVQKYFAKLTLNGIPLPGARNLGNNSKSKKSSNNNQQSQNADSPHPIRPSSSSTNSKKRKPPAGQRDKLGKKNNKTSGGQYLVNTPLVYMSDNDEDGRVSPTALPSNLSGNSNIIKIKLNLPKSSRHQDNSNSGEAAVHNGFKCDGCSSSPIVGIRWHCKRCEPPIDFCDQCAIKGRYKSTFHDRSHFLMKVTKAELPEFIDKDYKLDSLRRGEFSYLKD